MIAVRGEQTLTDTAERLSISKPISSYSATIWMSRRDNQK